ncbi:hypothetical protein FQN49_005460 [Arthroderma sp. PD_2]|nr:hypothetical protein FQN49_005460 [Arthroderma sp. PD_2]
MSGTTFSDLPLEILQYICNLLHLLYPPSVPDFACINKNCYSAATPLLFRVLKFSVHSLPELAKKVQQCSQALHRASGFGCVRHLIINDATPIETLRSTMSPGVQGSFDFHVAEATRSPVIRTFKRGLRHKPTPEWAEDNVEALADYFDDSEFSLNLNLGSSCRDGRRAGRWAVRTGVNQEPLVDLIKQLSGLTDLFYSCSRQFPDYLLETLHRSCPRCKLHLNTFDLTDFDLSDKDSYDVRLATSPSLYSVGFAIDTVSNPLSHEATAARLMTCLAPNLREVHMKLWTRNRNPPLSPGIDMDLSTMSSLQCLQLYTPATDVIALWNQWIDFSSLRVLRLEGCIKQDALEYLATECSFPSLVTLKLNITHDKRLRLRPVRSPPPDHFLTAGEVFLQGLPPLSALNIVGWHSTNMLGSVFEHHGVSLRRLSIASNVRNPLELRDIEQISSCCPRLEHLELSIHRRGGNAEEVALYRAIGSFKMLRNLTIQLVVSGAVYIVSEESDSESDLPSDEFYLRTAPYIIYTVSSRCLTQGQIRKILINSAVDKDLACEIFRTICSGGANNTLLPLVSMKIQVATDNCFSTKLADTHHLRLFNVVIDTIGGDWLVQRDPRDDRPEGVVARKVGSPPEHMELQHWLGKVFHRIWPKKDQAGGNWREVWHSFPLDTQEDNTHRHIG